MRRNPTALVREKYSNKGGGDSVPPWADVKFATKRSRVWCKLHGRMQNGVFNSFSPLCALNPVRWLVNRPAWLRARKQWVLEPSLELVPDSLCTEG